MPDLHSAPQVVDLSGGTFDRRSLFPTPSTSPFGRVSGCAMSSLKWRNGKLLLKTEVAMKNDRFGMVFWMGMKNTDGPGSFSSMRLQLTYKVALYERANGGAWRIRGGYSWRTEAAKDRVNAAALRITAPSGKRSPIFRILRESASNAKYRLPECFGYANMWEPDYYGGGDNGIRFTAKPFHRRDSGFTLLNLHPNEINGYGDGVDTFFYEGASGSGTWKWKRLRTPEGTFIRENVESTLKNWYNLVTVNGQQAWGHWREADDYCRSYSSDEAICGRSPNRPVTFTRLSSRRG